MKERTEYSLILNPFQRIAGWSALLIGLVAMLISGLMAGYYGAHFPDLITVLFTVSTGLYVPIAELLYGWVLLSLWSIILFSTFRIRNFRIVDLFGTIALSRTPYLLIAVLNAVASYFGYFNQAIIIPLLLIPLVWSYILIYNALQVSGNLKAPKSWIISLIVVASAEITILLTMSKIYLFIL